MTSQLFRTFLKIFTFASTLILLAMGLQAIPMGSTPKGTALCLIEFLVGMGTVVWTYRSTLPHRRSFANAILLIAVADALFYVVNYYFLENLSNTFISSTLLPCLYGSGFWLASQALRRSAQINIRRDYRKIIVPALIILVTCLYYFLPTMLQQTPNDASIFRYLFNGLILTLNIWVAIIALTILTQSMNSFFVLYSLGFTILPLSNFSISADVLMLGNLSFGFYEYFWAFGLFMAEGALLFLADEVDVRRDQRLSMVSQSSIGVQYKTAIITAVMIALMGSSLISKSSGIPIKIITVGIVVGIIFAVLVSSFAVEAVSRYSSLLGKYLQHGFTSRNSDDQMLAKLPVELEVLFSSVFAQTLEQERDRQMKAAKFNDLHKKLAHDIRSPLQALSHLLRDSDFKDHLLKNACMEAVQSMNRASKTILDDLELDVGGMDHSRSIPAINVNELISRVIRIFQFGLDGKAIEVNVAHDPLCKFAWMEESALERLLVNSLTNSAESANTRTIKIQTRRDGKQVVIEIEDDGEGADLNTLSKLNQGEMVTTKTEGHGIGMTAHRETLKNWGASIRFESESGRFFKTQLSLKAASDQIVLIDDDRAIHLAWAALARAKGVNLLTVGEDEDSVHKLAHLKNEQPEIYVDFHLGAVSGLQVLSKLKANGFTNLYLATSEAVEPSIHNQWRVRDKTFPR